MNAIRRMGSIGLLALSALPALADASVLDLSLDAQAAISAALGREDRGYHVVVEGDVLHLGNPDHGFSAEFRRAGVRVRTGAATWGWRLRGIGYGTASSELAAVVPGAAGNRIEYRRGALTEWYVNGPLGLEQGFDLSAPPAERSGAPLTLALALSGDLTAAVEASGDALTLSRRGDRPALRYRGLTAFDAAGRELDSWLELEGQNLLLRVDDAAARYPIVIDPFLEQAKLTASDRAVGDSLGWEVAIDGDTIVVGAPGDDSLDPLFGSTVNDHGSAYVFVKPAGGWITTSTHAAKLIPSNWAERDFFGQYVQGFFGVSVAIDGDTIVVGAWGQSEQAGSAFVFVEPALGWASTPLLTEATRLVDSDFGSLLGIDVAVLDDTVFVAADYSGDSDGAVLLFVEPVGGWATTPLMTETGSLGASDGFGGAGQHSIKLDADGDTVVVGAQGHDVGGNVAQGQAYVFVEPAVGWSTMTETARLAASDGAAGDGFGSSVGIRGDRVVVGAFSDDVGANVNQGSAYVFVHPAGGWATMTETAKLTASDGAANDSLGVSAAIHGGTIALGATRDDIGASSDQGSVYVFAEPPGGWTAMTEMTETLKLVVSDGATNDFHGAGLAIDGATVVSSAPLDDVRRGAAYVFLVCDDGDPCTTDTIDPGTGTCGHVAHTGPCDDGNSCTANDTCATGTCVGEGPPVCVCDDGNPCTDDSFDSGLGACVFAPNTDPCDDGNACTRIDTCGGGTCNGADPVVCVALDPCHDVGVCNPMTGFCSDPSSPDGTTCSDGSACTQVDTCQSGSCAGSDYAWSGVLQPINGDGSSIFKLGNTIPVKFRLTGACVGLLGLEARLYVAKLTDSVVGTEVEALSTSSADTGNLFRPAGDDQYVFNLSTDGLSTGTWVLRIDLGDGVLNRTVTVSLK